MVRLKNDLSRRWFSDDIPDILTALKREAIKGNPVAAKVFLEYVDNWQAEDEKNKAPVIITKNELNVYITELRAKEL